MKLIVDEFLEHILLTPGPESSTFLPDVSEATVRVRSGMTKRLIDCLSAFTSQIKDVNISLTSVETMWKVADVAITAMLVAVPEQTKEG